MPIPGAYDRRQFPGGAADTTITAGINASAISISLASATGWPTGTFTGGILIELYNTTTGATIEKVWGESLSGTTLSLFAADARGVDGTSAASHAAGTGIRPVAGAVDADEANKAVSELIDKATTAGQILYVSAANTYTALAIGASGRMLISNGSIPVWVAISGDITITSGGVVSIGASKITSAMIVDGTIATADIGASQITNALMADNAIGTAEIADDAVGLAEMAASAKPRWMIPFATTVASGTGAMGFPGAGGATQVPIPEACAVTGLSIACDATRSSGSASFEVTINGSGTGLTAAINGTDTQYATATQAETADAVSAGQRVGVTWTNSSLVGPDDLTAYVLLQAV